MLVDSGVPCVGVEAFHSRDAAGSTEAVSWPGSETLGHSRCMPYE
jgi:hypothetical protein